MNQVSGEVPRSQETPASGPHGAVRPAVGPARGGRSRPSGIVALPSWKFETQRPAEVRRDPVWAEFFNSADEIRDDREALVREAIQNSLDNPASPAEPVTVRFTLSGEAKALPSEKAGKYFQGLRDHVDKSKGSAGVMADRCRFLLVEDFETFGLRGNPATRKDEGGVRNDFAYFFWTEGKSGKGGKDGGRWGIGKYVFPMASQIYSYFGYTVRSPDVHDEGEGLLMGGATLVNHELGGLAYLPDGRWGRQEDSSSPFLPQTHKEVLREFREDWSITRRPDQPGLSVVVPYVDSEWTLSHILQAVLEEYFVAILDDQLIVEIRDLSSGEEVRLDPAGVKAQAGKIADPERRKRTLSDVDLIERARTGTKYQIGNSFPDRAWNTAKHDDSVVKKVREDFDKNDWVQVLVDIPIEFKAQGVPSQTGQMRVLMQREDGFRGKPLFVRNGIIVKSATLQKTHGTRVIVLIDEPGLAQMLGDAEGPAHVRWAANTQVFKDRYKYGANWLSVVRQTPAQMIKLIEALGDDRDYSLAKDFFAIPTMKPGGKPTGSPRKPSGPIAPKPALIRKEQRADGFELRLAKGAVANRIVVSVGYGRRKGSPFTKWTPEDFTLDGTGPGPAISLGSRGCRMKLSGNEIVVTRINSKRFRLDLDGFDTKRDVAVRWEVS